MKDWLHTVAILIAIGIGLLFINGTLNDHSSSGSHSCETSTVYDCP